MAYRNKFMMPGPNCWPHAIRFHPVTQLRVHIWDVGRFGQVHEFGLAGGGPGLKAEDHVLLVDELELD